MRHALRLSVLILLLTLVAATARAQEAGVTLQLEAASLTEGEIILGTLTCLNTGVPRSLDLPKVNGLSLELESSRPTQKSSVFSVNGKTTQRVTYTYRLRVSAELAGRHVVPAITVNAARGEFKTSPKSILVKKPDLQAGKRADQILYAALDIDRDSVYITETVVATLTIGIRKIIYRGRYLDADYLQSTLDQSRSSLAEFLEPIAARNYHSRDIFRTDSNGKRRAYSEYVISREIRLDDVGELSIGPVQIHLNYPTKLGRSLFGDVSVESSRPERVLAQGVTVTVKAPPAAGRPADFTGAIGHYRMNVSAKPREVHVGEPITLTVQIQGRPLVGVAGPDLAANPQLASRFDFTGDELVGDIDHGHKTFRKAIFPKQPGEQELPPITWSYFDLDQEKYVTLRSSTVSLSVHQSDHPSARANLGLGEDGGQRDGKGTSLTAIVGGITPNYTRPANVLADQRVALGLLWWPLMAGPPLVYAALTILEHRRRRLRDDASYARRRRARSAAEQRIQAALQEGSEGQRLAALAAALSHFVADRLGLTAGHLTAVEVGEALREKARDAGREDNDWIDAIVEFLGACEAARYAGSHSAGERDAASAAKQLRSWIAQIERV